MPLSQNNYAVRAISPNGSGEPFHVGPLPGTGRIGVDLLNAQAVPSIFNTRQDCLHFFEGRKSVPCGFVITRCESFVLDTEVRWQARLQPQRGGPTNPRPPA